MPTLAPISVSADTFIVDTDPNANNSSSTDVTIYKIESKFTAEYRGLFQFDLSTLPKGISITEAKLTLYGSTLGVESADIRIARATKDVVVSEATWNQYSTGNNWDTTGGDFTLGNAVTIKQQETSFDVDITGIVQDSSNLSLDTLNLIIYQPTTPPANSWHIAAIEDGVDPEAKLTISYVFEDSDDDFPFPARFT